MPSLICIPGPLFLDRDLRGIPSIHALVRSRIGCEHQLDDEVRLLFVSRSAPTNRIHVSFVISEISPVMLEDITYGTYLFYLAFMLMGVAYVIWVLPETRGKSLEEMVSSGIALL